ncbi:MAG: ABC transporter substrate-binding protein [Burkholderiaceae bacterium]
MPALPLSRPPQLPRPTLRRRGALAALATAPWWPPLARADDLPLRLRLDWRIEGPSALFLWPLAKGYFRDEKLAVTVDEGSGSGSAVNRVASGQCELAFADLSALMEFHANNPGAPNLPVAVMVVYNNTPSAVVALRRSGIRAPADLTGRRLGAPVFDAARRAFPIFQKANGVGTVQWVSMDPPQREAMLLRGEVDAITGFTFTSQLNLLAAGARAEELVVMAYPDHGVKLYGNVIVAGADLLRRRPDAVRGFLRAFARGTREVLAHPPAAAALVKARDPSVDQALEERRLRMAVRAVLDTPDARREGFGDLSAPRLALMASQVADAYGTPRRVDPDAVWNGSLLPSARERAVLPGQRGA